MKFDFTAILALACLILGFLAWAGFADAANKADTIDRLEAEAKQRNKIETADNRARETASAGRAEIEAMLRDFVRENAVAPVSEVCLSDPAIVRAYDTIERMRDTHHNALRTPPGGASRKVRAP